MGKQAIRVHMDEALVAEIDEQAEREDRSRNWTINDLVRRGLAAVRVEEAMGLPPGTIRVKRGGVPEGIPTDEGWVAPQTPEPEIETSTRPHRHRFVAEISGTRRGLRGRQVADYACECGEIKREVEIR